MKNSMNIIHAIKVLPDANSIGRFKLIELRNRIQESLLKSRR